MIQSFPSCLSFPSCPSCPSCLGNNDVKFVIDIGVSMIFQKLIDYVSETKLFRQFHNGVVKDWQTISIIRENKGFLLSVGESNKYLFLFIGIIINQDISWRIHSWSFHNWCLVELTYWFEVRLFAQNFLGIYDYVRWTGNIHVSNFVGGWDLTGERWDNESFKWFLASWYFVYVRACFTCSGFPHMLFWNSQFDTEHFKMMYFKTDNVMTDDVILQYSQSNG